MFLQNFFKFPAQKCLDIPPNPPAEGKVVVHNNGIKFGVECLGKNGVENLPGSGCNGVQVLWKSRENETSASLGIHWVTTYDIFIDVPQTSENVEVLFTFSHEVTLTNVEISGKVRKNNLKTADMII